MSERLKRFATAVATLVCCTSLVAQGLQEQITVDFVEVPVYVTSYNGGVIAGLDRDRFELYVNGVPHPIESFEVIVDGDEGGDEASPIALDRRRKFVLLFDLVRWSPIATERARAAAQELVSTAPAADTFAVATITRRGVNIIVPFTTDRVVTQRAIATLRPSSARDAFNLAMLGSERAQWERSADAVTEREWGNSRWAIKGRFLAGAALADAADAPSAVLDDEQGFITASYFAHLGAFADRLGAIDGIKHVILLSHGGGGPDLTSLQEIVRMHQRFRRAGVILDAATTGLPDAPWTADDVPTNPAEGLYALALDTGGTVASHARVIDSLRALRKSQSVTYLLGFRAPPNQKEYNAIRVRVRDLPFLSRVRHRPGFSRTGASAENGDGLFLADVMLNDIPQRGVTLDLTVRGEASFAIVEASIPGAEMMALARERDVALDVYFYVFDEQRSVAGWGHARVVVDLEKARDFLTTRPYTMRQQFDLPPGRYAAKALVRVRGSGATGFRRADFRIGESARAVTDR